MSDTLLYRAPGDKAQEYSGVFQKVDDLHNIKGFVIESFDKKQRYHFIEGEGEPNFWISEKGIDSQLLEEYKHDSGEFLRELKNKNIRKAVYARVKGVPFEGNPRQLFHRLSESYPNAFVYLMSSPLFGCWIGASPEILIKQNLDRISTVALAGTKPSESKDVWNDKEIDEQECVRLFIRETLEGLNVENLRESDRYEIKAGPVKHLVNEFEFLSEVDIIQIAELLHPTPAVSGLPRPDALGLINDHEKINRSLYAGFLGVVGEEESQLFVNLRCAQLVKNMAYLYLGGGFTKDSVVENEWEETENKANTLESIMKG